MEDSQDEYTPTQAYDDWPALSPLARKRPRRSASDTCGVLTALQFGLGGALDSQTTDTQYLEALTVSPKLTAPTKPTKREALETKHALPSKSVPVRSNDSECARCRELQNKIAALTQELKNSNGLPPREVHSAWYYKTMYHAEMAKTDALTSALERCGGDIPLEEQSQEEFLSPSPIRKRTAKASSVKPEGIDLPPFFFL
ncbi:hypothetical protein GLOTRDRAFT_141654 [Gloeophyllum trabeum ATCC 11539]|uniref:Uncharacterized protein n=1 Tax=Gloeophyllum trabeum (strain ATCC 11539 / FP-39264 / Madison 617) TaxID=670483 RepID=S7RBX4_GLOTA|nr:uncharacterized protein GLOTRDRAFT_141654 [Gloeophyllum trabeum ATCC 11539]EPQ49889.1 hypothetical protein GLOTRDRAFT_141654 [Gloeophyllum trabeum ATCC 11539]